ncbi:MAG: TRAP transporter permease [Pseudomonadales bacterium]
MTEREPFADSKDWLTAVIALLSCFVVIDQLRLWGAPLLGSWIRLETQYYFLLIALLLPGAFLIRPSRWLLLDGVLGLGALLAPMWLLYHGEAIVNEGWEFVAPNHAMAASLALWILVLEAVRRVAGWSLFLIAGIFSLYPLIADRMPEMISGMAIGLPETANYHAMSIESIVGLPFRAFATLVIGFVVFGATLQHTGGGAFFIRLAFAFLGRTRGGAAKVAIVSSGLMGSMSGSVITNVMTTGQLTIPAMRRQGLSKQAAAAVEACASTGGVLLPPIMGSTAFIMATFLEMPYYQVALAALIPSLLYFAALYLQLDAHALKHDIKGMPESEIPPLRQVLVEGWFYIGAFALLIVLLLVLQQETLAPWVATAALLLINQILPQQRMSRAGLKEWLTGVGQLLIELLAILAAVGLIVGALSVTGLSGTLVNELLFVAGDRTWILIVMGAMTSFVLGIGLTVTAAYVFLAIVLAPALIEGGLMPLGVHLFILYWGMLSFITPPVALGAFAAASIAGANPVATGFEAMRMGIAIYWVPFLFVVNPSLIGFGPWQQIALSVFEAVLGILAIAWAAQRFLPRIGRLSYWAAGLLGFGGLLVSLPTLELEGLALSNSVGNVLGFGLILLSLAQRFVAGPSTAQP